MSGNPKQTAAGGQQMRYTTSPYSSLQPPLQPRDTFQLTNQNYVQQQPNQAGSQGAGLRGIGQTGPPNQAPTPPNQDHKVQAVPQQPPMNLYQSQSAVRPTQQFNYRPPGPPNQTSRMANNQHRTPFQNQQQIYQTTPPTQFVQMPVHSSMYLPQMQYFNAAQQRPTFVQQQVTLLHGQQFPTYPAFTPTQITQNPPTVAYPYYPTIQRAGPPPQPTSTQSTPNQTPMPTMPLTQPIASQQPRLKRPRPNALAVIDPNTGLNIFDEIFLEDSSHPPSGDSSARQTPQPAPHNPNKEVQATFAKQVAQKLSEETSSFEEDRHSSTGDHMEPPPAFHPPPQQAVHSNVTKLDHIVQTSILKAHAKEFVLPSAKETPIVSAICDSEEVTLPNKHQKGRESPAKGKKRDTKDHHREPTKDVHPPKEVHQPEKQQPAPVIVKEEPIKVKEPVVSPAASQPFAKPAEKEADKRKKDSKSDSKPSEPIVSERVVQVTPSAPPPHQEPEATAPVNAKSKHNSSQRKETQKSNQKPTNVPPPQPAKSSSKTSKKNEINNKGASKEGTEMDVFQIADTVNANVPDPTNESDVINANTLPVTNNATPTIVNSNATVVDTNNKKNESNDTATINKPAPEVKPVRWQVDVTNIFGGNVTKPVFIPPTTHDVNRDETDRAALANKFMQAKNDANAAKTANSTDGTESQSELPYRQGQWAPFNLEGDKKYDIDFLMAVRNLPNSKIKPPNLPEIVDYTLDGNRARQPDSRYGSLRQDFNMPSFGPYTGKNASMKGPQSITKHNSLPGKMNSKGGKSTNGANKITITLGGDIKLHETENAWKPGRLAKGETRTDEELKTEELNKKVRGVLNKLTPQKFDTLLNQIKSLKVDTMERLMSVINLIFEKAVDEPNFSVAYAKMCRELSFMQVPTSTEKKDDLVNFRKLLINRCQEEFEKQSKDETKTLEKKKEIEDCTDPEKKKDLEFELEEMNRQIRMRSVGNIRFIGELFKISMLTANIMITCLNILLKEKDEESLECLCKLLSTVGKELERTKDLKDFFTIMQEIVNKKHAKCSSRIRFMLQDVIDLRRNGWVPRRQDLNPKTIDQIQKEAENEHLNQAINSVSNTPSRNDRMGGDMNKGKSRQVTDDGWVTRNSRANVNQSFTVQKEKLKVNALCDNERLGASATFMKFWGKGAQLKPQPVQTDLTNKFAVLDGPMDTDKKMSGNGRYRDQGYSSKGSSLERSNYSKQSYDNRAGSRSGSQHRMNDAPVSSVPPRMAPPMAPVIPAAPFKPTPPTTPPPPAMTEDQMERYSRNCLEEYINDNCTFEECESDIRMKLPDSYKARMVADGYLGVLEKFAAARTKTGIFFAKLIKVGTLPLESYCVGLEEIFTQVEDLIIDIPTIWNCLAEIIVPVIAEEALPLSRLQKSCELLIGKNLADKLLAPTFKLIINEKGSNFLTDLWQISELNLSDFMPASRVDSFVKENQLESMVGADPSSGNSQLSYEQIEKKLCLFFQENAAFDEICNWITIHVGERVKENLFIRTLATAIYKYSIVRTKLDSERLNRHYKLFQKYVDNNQQHELQCLFALQALVHQLEHPQGLLLSIFDKLSEDVVFAQESFIAWETNKDPAELAGKGVATKQLTSFFTQLKENEEDEDDYGSTGSEET